MNLYAYVGNNAINYSDPLGLYSWREFGSDVGNAWNSLSNDPRVNGGVKIVGGLLETTFGTFMIVDGGAICMSVGGCLVGGVLVVQGSINFWGGIGTTADGITQLITGEFEDRGSQYLNAVDNGLNYFGANCTTKAVVKGVGVAIDTAYTIKGIVKSAGKIFTKETQQAIEKIELEGGYYLEGHSLERATERSISYLDIEKTIINGEKNIGTKPGTVDYILKGYRTTSKGKILNLKVTVNPETKKIVTVFPFTK